MAGCDQTLGSIWPDDLYIVVPVSGGQYINAGGQVITLPGKFKGWKIRVNKNSIPLDYENQGTGDPYFQHDPINNFINLSVDAVELDKFCIMAYKPVK